MTADLYVRVSTDEQADKGYSQRDQEERLRRYCELQKITVRRVIMEDHSAKTFKRPEWTKLLGDLKKRRGQINCILFTKWDRFSRNAGDAYQMINTLRKLEVEPQAIEQPLDLSVPENKMMLAFYLAAPEVENDRRALNVLHGMRRARKEGRWMGQAPIGYVNKITEDGKKYIAPKEPEAGLLKWAFKTVATGQYTVLDVYKQARAKGLNMCRANFWNSLRNPVYCGKVYIAPYKDETARTVPGLHQPIISESLFYDVQDYLDGRKKNYRTKVGSQDILQLRGYLLCPKCGKLLTGSASKGNGGQYYYYHCGSSCGARFKAENANDLFCRELRKYIPKPGMEKVYARVMNTAYKIRTKGEREDIRAISEQIEAANLEVARGRKLLLKEEIDAQDFREIKRENEKKIEMLEVRLIEVSRVSTNIEPLLEKAVSNLAHLDELYEEGDVKRKRIIIGSIYPEKLTFDGFRYRTTRVNEAVELIYALDLGFSQNETGQTKEVFDLSSVVAQPGFEPRRADPESAVLPLYYWAIEGPYKWDREIREFLRYLPKLLALVKFKECVAAGSLVLILLPGLSPAQPPNPAGLPAASLVPPQPPKTADNGPASPEANNRPASPPAITNPSPADSSIKSAFAMLDSLFRRPKFLYVAVGPDIPADIQPIIARMNNAIAANQAWFQQYRDKYPNQPLPYDEHFGVTPSQYYSILRLQATPPPLVPIDSQTVTVIKEGSLIHLQCGGTGEEHLLNYLYIDPVHRVLEYGGDTIPFAGPASAGPNNPYGQWNGYAWHLERIQSLSAPVDPLLPADAQKAPDQKLISARIVEVNFGIPTDGSPKTFIRIQYQNVQAGIATGNMELLGYIE